MPVVSAPSRIHISLIDLNGSLGRVDGGVGFALQEPRVMVRVERSSELSVSGRHAEVAERAAERVLSAYSLPGARVEVLSAYPRHVGLGSGTQLSLAVARGICSAYGIESSVRELAEITRRGGTSGIGVLAFEAGGFVLDAGHAKKLKQEFLPSSASTAPPPVALMRRDMPDWEIAVVLPACGERVHSRREVNIFRDFCPLPLSQVQELCHILLMKLLPSLVERDIESFGEGINMIQRVGFKSIELMLQRREVRELLSLCQRLSYGAGLSSFGPVIYAFPRSAAEFAEAVSSRSDVRCVWFTRADNRGAAVR